MDISSNSCAEDFLGSDEDIGVASEGDAYDLQLMDGFLDVAIDAVEIVAVDVHETPKCTDGERSNGVE
ncbi:hypothetical protein PIB30_072846 [Stylosanthes scabra]|uniref:Uncharacterized protein n=1 Tax=Stylosanthes scabra TaxID=79078 RepID=A0ABU6UQW9_9FABA|nr:hypothetical protein [Stylosanthes scabra]